MKKTILLLTYDISPYSGSEASVGWNYIVNMSKHHQLFVLYGKGKDDIDQYSETNVLANVQFQNVAASNVTGKGLLFEIKYNLNYRSWHKAAYKIAKELIAKEHIDLVHYLNPIGFKEPGFLWKLNKPYIWGPMKCVNNRPFCLYKALSWRGKFTSLMKRTIHNGMLYCMPRVRQAMMNSDTVFASVTYTQKQLKRIFHKDSMYLPENGILNMETNIPVSYNGDILNLIFVGRIDENKALILLLESLTKIKDKPFCLHVVGDGVKQNDLKNYAKEQGLADKIIWYGKIDRTQVQQVFKQAHLHVITSLGEGNPTTLWEAMSNAIPTMSLDHCGMSDVVCERCGIKIVIHSYNQVIRDMAKQIDTIVENPSIIQTLSEGVLECSKKFMWTNRVEIFNEAYETAITNYQKNRKK